MVNIEDEALELINNLYVKAGTPTYSKIASRASCSKSTVFAVLQGNMIQWPSLKRVAEALNADDETIKRLQHLWITNKMNQKPKNVSPLWVMELDRKIDVLSTKLDIILQTINKS